MNDHNSNENNQRSLERLNFWIGNVDAKSSFLLSLAGVIIGFIFSNDSITSLLKGYIAHLYFHFDIQEIKSWGQIFAALLFVVALLLIVCAIFRLLNVLRGRISHYHEHMNQPQLQKNSLLFWGTIAQKPYRRYKRELSLINENEYKEDVLSQIYINSFITHEKFKSYNKAADELKWGIGLFVIFKCLSYFPLFNS